MMIDHAAVYDLFAEYGALIDMAKFDEWLDLRAGQVLSGRAHCRHFCV